MIFDNKEIQEKYLENLKKLDYINKTEKNVRLGKKLYYLVFDFISILTDWKKEVAQKYSSNELYIKTWTECRTLILPMNPQRRELEYAIRLSLKNLGVQIKTSSKKTLKKSK